MRSLEYNYQLIYKLRDAKIFQVKRYIKLIQRHWRTYTLRRKSKAVSIISKAYKERRARFKKNRAIIRWLKIRVAARRISRWWKLQKKMRIIRPHLLKLRSLNLARYQAQLPAIILIQSLVRSHLARKSLPLHRCLKVYYLKRNVETFENSRFRRYRAERLKNSTLVGMSMQKLVKDRIYYTYRFQGKCK